MRVTGGSLGGRKIKVDGKSSFRPTSDRVKTAIFNILPHDLSGSRVLDLFAGSGALGIEALSRGAEAAVFVDNSRDSFRLIKTNLRELGLMAKARLLSKKASPAIKELSEEDEKFDYILMDPPYKDGFADKTLALLSSSNLVSERTLVVVEHAKDEKLNENYNGLMLRDQRKYGDSLVSFFSTGPGK